MAAYCQVYGVIHFTSPAGCLPVHRNQLRAQRSVTSMGKLYFLPFSIPFVSCFVCIQISHVPYARKGSPYSITERRVPELIPILGSQPAGDVSHKPGGKLPLLSTRPAVTPATLKRLLPILLLGEQRHDGCEQFA